MKNTPKTKSLACSALFVAALLAGCGESTENTATSENGSTTESGKSAPEVQAREDLPVKKIEITGNDLMKFNLEKLEAQSRQRVEVTFKNVGTMPKESMGHNWCLLTKNADAMKIMEAGFASASNGYISPEDEDQVIARTKIIGPGESETITFTAPEATGSYEYICTFPGHFMAGMKGVLEISE
jgi:azurin